MEFKSDHAGDILNNLNRERISSKDFCDFTIKAGNEKFAIHRCVVGSFSKFFKNLLTAEMKEKHSKEPTVQFSPNVVELVINFIYTSCVKISMDSVYEVLEASEFLEIPYLKDYCEKVFKKHLTGGNCLKIRTYAKVYQMQEITQLAEFCICDNLSSVLQSEEFCDLAVDDVGSLLDLDNEEPTIDECKYSSLIKWTKHDIDARSSKFSSLFPLINLQWLSREFINTVVLKEKLVGDSFECMSQVVTALNDLVPEDLIKKTKKPVHKSAKDEAENFLLIGGYSCPQSVVKYDVRSKQFSDDLPNTNVSRMFASAVNYNGRIFLMGGCDDCRTLNSVEILNLNESTLKWEISQTSMIERRYWFASALLNDVIYCVGGIDDGNQRLSLTSVFGWVGDIYQDLSSVEGYDVKVGKWFRKNKMNQVRSHHALVSTQGMLFTIGGQDGNRPTNTAEMFDPNVGNWRNIPSMKTCRSGLCAVVLNQEIYAIGGMDDDGKPLSSVEKYNLASQRWSDVTSMKEKRSGGNACVVNGRIYVFGGNSPANTVQSYHQEMNEWFIEAEMDKTRNYLSVLSI